MVAVDIYAYDQSLKKAREQCFSWQSPQWCTDEEVAVMKDVVRDVMPTIMELIRQKYKGDDGTLNVAEQTYNRKEELKRSMQDIQNEIDECNKLLHTLALWEIQDV